MRRSRKRPPFFLFRERKLRLLARNQPVVLASVLKLAAGALAGFLYSRSVSLNRNVV